MNIYKWTAFLVSIYYDPQYLLAQILSVNLIIDVLVDKIESQIYFVATAVPSVNHFACSCSLNRQLLCAIRVQQQKVTLTPCQKLFPHSHKIYFNISRQLLTIELFLRYALQKVLAQTPSVKHITYMKGKGAPVSSLSVTDGKDVVIASMEEVISKGNAMGKIYSLLSSLTLAYTYFR